LSQLSAAITVSLDKKSLEEVTAALREFSAELQDRIAKGALRQFAKFQMAGIRAGNAGNLNPKHLAYRVKMWPSGIAWLGVGYRQPPGFLNVAGTGSARRVAYDAMGVGWRSHFTELGYHTWGGGLQRPPGRKGKGWKKGLYHRGRGVAHRGTLSSVITAQATSPMLLPFLRRELAFMAAKSFTGKGAKRQKISAFTGSA
jgi:hypothetical protein